MEPNEPQEQLLLLPPAPPRQTKVTVRSSGKETGASAPGPRNDESNHELSALKGMLDAPFTTTLESILIRSRFDGRKSARLCLSEFRQKRPKMFWLLVTADMLARGIFVIIAVLFFIRGADLHPVESMAGSIFQIRQAFYAPIVKPPSIIEMIEEKNP